MGRVTRESMGLKLIVHGYVANKDHIATSPIKNGMYVYELQELDQFFGYYLINYDNVESNIITKMRQGMRFNPDGDEAYHTYLKDFYH